MQAATAAAVPARVPTGATANGDGIVLGDGPVRVDAYIDFLCPFCRQFEGRSGSTLERLVGDPGRQPRLSPARLPGPALDHPVLVARVGGSDDGRFAEYKDALFANQPPEGGPGLSDAELIAVGVQVGLDEATFGRCVLSRVYLPWAAT